MQIQIIVSFAQISMLVEWNCYQYMGLVGIKEALKPLLSPPHHRRHKARKEYPIRHEEDDQLRNDYKGQSQDPGLHIVVADVDVVAVADAANVVAVVVVVDDDTDADVYDDDDVVYDDDDDDDDNDDDDDDDDDDVYDDDNDDDDDDDDDVYDDDDVVYDDDDDDDDDDDAHDHDDDERAENDWPLQGTNRKPHSNKEGRHNKGRHW